MSDDMMVRDLLALAPEGALAIAAVTGLLLGSFLQRRRQWVVRVIAAVGALGVVATTVPVRGNPSRTLFDGSYGVDVATNTVRLVVAGSLLILLAMSTPETRRTARESEFVVMLVLSGLGAILLAGSEDLLVLIVAYLLASIPLYALVGFGKDALGTEAALKYYLLGALFGTTMVFGAALVYGAGGATAYPTLLSSVHGAPKAALVVGAVAVLGGLLFKAGAVPAQFWIPDVVAGTRAPVAALVTTVPKLGAVVAIYRLAAMVLEPSGLNWRLLIAIIATATMILGNFAAFFQTDVRRLLGYSTISQIGYLLVGVVALDRSGLALPAVLIYLAAYAVTNLGAFALVCAMPHRRTIDDYTGLLRRHPGLAVALIVCLLGLIGTPPTGVFVAKLSVFTAAFDAGYGWLVVVAVANAVASVFYYLRWIVPTLKGTERGVTPEPINTWVAYVGAAASVAIGIFAGPIMNAMTGPLALP